MTEFSPKYRVDAVVDLNDRQAIEKTIFELWQERARLRWALGEVRDELAKWGQGDMHYGPQAQESSVVETLAKIDRVLGRHPS